MIAIRYWLLYIVKGYDFCTFAERFWVWLVGMMQIHMRVAQYLTLQVIFGRWKCGI